MAADLSDDDVFCSNNHDSVKMKLIKKSKTSRLFQCPRCSQKISIKSANDKNDNSFMLLELSDGNCSKGIDYNALISAHNEKIRKERNYLRNKYWTIFEKIPPKFHLPSVLFWIIFSQFIFLIYYIIALFVGESNVVLHDFSYLAPLIIGIGFMLCDVWLNILDDFYEKYRSIHALCDASSLESYEEFLKIIYRPVYLIVGGVIGIVLMFVISGGLWYDSGLLNAYVLFICFIGGISVGYGCWIDLGTIYMIYRVSKTKLKLDINHPDGVGGLKVLGILSLKCSFLMVVVETLYLIVVLLLPWSYGPGSHFWMYVYVLVVFFYLLGIISYVLPLMGIHDYLKKYKYDELHAIDIEMDKLMDDSNLSSKPASLKKYSLDKDKTEKYSELIQIRKQIISMREWPFDLRSIGELMSSLFIPSLLIIIRHFFG